MKDLQSRPFVPRPSPPVSINPKWFDGTEDEVNRHFADFKQLFADDDQEITTLIGHIKDTSNITDAGTKLLNGSSF